MATFHYDYEYLLTWKPERERLTRPVYQSLAKALEDDIASGALPAGTKLPPQRELANFLDIHFTDLTRAINLRTEGPHLCRHRQRHLRVGQRSQ